MYNEDILKDIIYNNIINYIKYIDNDKICLEVIQDIYEELASEIIYKK